MKILKKIFNCICILGVFTTYVDCITLRITCRAKGIELELFKTVIREWEKQTGNNVEIVVLPHSSNECLALYKQWIGAESFDIDILQMDIAWLGVFADNLADISSFFSKEEIDEFNNDCFPAIRNNMYSANKLVALPVYTDCQIMYYRKDLLEKYHRKIPQTWVDLFETAKFIQNEERKLNNRFYGYVFQAKAFEMLTCNFIQLIDSFGGKVIEDKKSDINSKSCEQALIFLMNCLDNISPHSVLNYSEEEARGLFQAGNALFMNSWPYAWSLMNDSSTSVSGKIGVIPIPKCDDLIGKPSGVLGGWFFVVNKFSKHTKFAAELIKFLTSKQQHKIRAKYAYAPAYMSLYNDKDILKINPFFITLKQSLNNAVTRPSIEFGKSYPRASTEIFNLVNTALTEAIEENNKNKIAKRYLNRLNRKLNKILNRKNRREGAHKSIGIIEKFKYYMKRTMSFLGL